MIQPTGSVARNEALAVDAAPELEARLADICAKVPGARFERLRPMKNPARVIEKVTQEAKPPQTIADYLAAQIAADSVRVKDRLVALLRRGFNVVNVEDRFLQGRPGKGGYPSTNVQVQMLNGLTAEVQIVPREVQDVTLRSHEFYRQGREAYDAGNYVEGDKLFAVAKRINKEALGRFIARNRGQVTGHR